MKILVLLLLLFTSPVWGAAAHQTTTALTAISASTIGGSVTVSAGSNLALYCTVMIASATGAAVSGTPTYNSVGMTHVADDVPDATFARGDMWRLVAPSTGANTVTFNTTAGFQSAVLICSSFTGVDQTTPEGAPVHASQHDTGTLITVPTDGLGYEVSSDLQSVTGCVTSQTAGGSQTSRQSPICADAGVAQSTVAMASTIAATATPTWTSGGGGPYMIQIGVPLNPAGAAIGNFFARRRN